MPLLTTRALVFPFSIPQEVIYTQNHVREGAATAEIPSFPATT